MQSSFFQEFGFILILVALIFEIILKGIALWKAARHGQKNWFIAILLINTIGILPGVYLLFFQRTLRAKGHSSKEKK